jgi:diguanylate cyclase (GGDEF)-like protein
MLLVVVCAIAVFTVAADFVVYTTQSLTSAAHWVQHTQQVLSSLQRASLLAERVEYRTRLYLLAGGDQLNRARTSANSLRSLVAHIRTLVADNPAQTSNDQILAVQVDQLNQALNSFNAQSHVPEREVEACQQTVRLMTNIEQTLLTQRALGSQRKSFATIGTEIAFVGLFLVTPILLFGLLLRNAMPRQQTSKQLMLANENLAQTVRALENRAREAALLTAAIDEVQLCVYVHQVYDAATNGFWRLLPGTSGCLCMINDSRQIVEVVSSWGAPAMQNFSPPESCCGLRAGQPRWREPGKSEIHCAHFADGAPERYLCRPIIADGVALGVLYVQCESDVNIQLVNQRIESLHHLVQITGMAIATLSLRGKLENQSIRDSLTGLFNRRFMEISLDQELSLAARRKQILAVFMLDVDHFKQFNDTYGHSAGDAALKEIAKILHANIRGQDVAYRYGGEEFTILLTNVTVKAACERAERILQTVANLQVTEETQTYSNLTISIGIAFYPNDGETAELLLRRADEALYRSKRQGRNRYAINLIEAIAGQFEPILYWEGKDCSGQRNTDANL